MPPVAGRWPFIDHAGLERSSGDESMMTKEAYRLGLLRSSEAALLSALLDLEFT
jgi:hypothetical protein